MYGEDNPTFEYDVTSGAITSGTPVITCSATKTSPPGIYDIVISKGTVSNSSVNLVNGTLTVLSVKGDVNGDGAVNVAEIGSVIDCMSGAGTVDRVAADVNGDSNVDVADIATIIDIMSGK